MLQINTALANAARRAPAFKREYDSVGGYLVRAARDIAPGEKVFKDEGTTVRIVTLPHVVAEWAPEDQKVFAESAWPLGVNKHFYAMWDADPAQWRPFNHSCEPNLIFGPNRSLDAVAARAIAKGEELTMDYATMCDNLMPPFECHCGTPSCRKLIKLDAPSMLATDRLFAVPEDHPFYAALAEGKRLMPLSPITSNRNSPLQKAALPAPVPVKPQ